MIGEALPAPPECLKTESRKRGVRYNSSKVPISMIFEARRALEGCSRVMGFGAQKYSRANWRKGLPLTEVADSLSRHLVAWLSGEDNDPETGLPHLDHLLCNAIFISELAHTRPDLDDRPIKEGIFIGKNVI